MERVERDVIEMKTITEIPSRHSPSRERTIFFVRSRISCLASRHVAACRDDSGGRIKNRNEDRVGERGRAGADSEQKPRRKRAAC